MHLLADAFYQGGPFMWLLVALFALGLPVALIQGALAASRIRIPVAGWLLAPLLLLLAGAVGTLLGMDMVLDAVVYASLEVKSALSSAGYAAALYTTAAGLLLAGVLLGIGAWCAAAGVVIAPRTPRSGGAIPAVLGGGLLALTGAGIFLLTGLAGEAQLAIAIALVVLSPAVALSGTRHAADPEVAAAQAEGRLSVAVCVLGATISIALFSVFAFTIAQHDGLARASPEARSLLLMKAIFAQELALKSGAAAVLAAGLAGALAVAGDLGRIPVMRTMVSGAVVGAGLLLVGAAAFGVGQRYDALTGYWLAYTTEGLERLVSDLPEDHDVTGAEASPDSIDYHTRILLSEGGRWVVRSEDGSTAPLSLPLEETDDDLAPLLVVSKDTPASQLAQSSWSAESLRLQVLTHTPALSEAQGDRWLESLFKTVSQLRWLSPDQAETSPGDPNSQTLHRRSVYRDDQAIFIVGQRSTVRLFRPTDHQTAKTSTHQSLAEAVAAVRQQLDLTPITTVVLVPDPTWTVQDLVSLCHSTVTQATDPHREQRECALMGAFDPPPLPTDAAPAGITTADDDIVRLGALDKADIQAVIRQETAGLRRCYEEALESAPALSGRVEVKIVIARDGSVSQATIERSTLGAASVEACLARHFKAMRFPEPDGGGIVIVRYPLIFEPG